MAAFAVKFSKFEAARKHKPVKPMKKLNWVKVSQRDACSQSALWSKSLKGDFDTKVDIDPTTVEELFSRAEIKKAKKGEKEGEAKPKEPSVVSWAIVCQFPASLTSWCVMADKFAGSEDQFECQHLPKAVQNVRAGPLLDILSSTKCYQLSLSAAN